MPGLVFRPGAGNRLTIVIAMPPQRRVHSGRTYDQRPPWWFRYGHFWFVPFAAFVVGAGVAGHSALLWYSPFLLLGFLAAVVIWSDRHRQRPPGGDWWRRL